MFCWTVLNSPLWKLKHWAIYCDLTKQLHRTHNINRHIVHYICQPFSWPGCAVLGPGRPPNTPCPILNAWLAAFSLILPAIETNIFVANTKSNAFKYNLNHNSFDLVPSSFFHFFFVSLCYCVISVVPETVKAFSLRYYCINVLRRWQKSFIIRHPTIT